MALNVDEMNLSFGGCGYLGIYHLGVGSCFREHAPHVFQNKIAGASVGALVAGAFLCNVPVEICASKIMEVTMKTRSGLLGALKPENGIMEMLRTNMSAMLPEDAHVHCNGKLHISVTRKRDHQNVLLNHFDSKTEVLDALMCSCYIPLYCGNVFPKFRGEEYMDGGCSDNMPKLDENSIRIFALYGQSDIHPPRNGYVLKTFQFSNTVFYCTLENMIRFVRILCPGGPNMLQDLCQQGYNDALMFLRDHGIIPCPNCKNLSGEIKMGGYLDHSACDAMHQSLSPRITGEFARCLKELQGTYLDWLLEYQLFKLVYFLNTPNIAIGQWSYFFIKVICRRLKTKASSCAENLLNDFLKLLKHLMHSTGVSTQLSCQLAAIENGCCGEEQFFFHTNGMVKTKQSNESQNSIEQKAEVHSASEKEQNASQEIHCNGKEAHGKQPLNRSDEERVSNVPTSVVQVDTISNLLQRESNGFTHSENNQILELSNMLDVSGRYSALNNIKINISSMECEAVSS